MSTLAEKMRKARESIVPVGGFSFTILRPTDLDMMEFSKDRNPAGLIQFVVGWEGIKEMDLIPGGDGHPVPFDAEACAEWLADRSDLFIPLVNSITDAYQARQQALEEARKN
mgnify:CR=1 FL=1